MSSGRNAIRALLCVLLVFVPLTIMAQEVDVEPGSRSQVMLGIRVLKISLSKKYAEGLDWKSMPFKPGLNDRIDFYRVLKSLKAAGDVEVLFNQSLIGISGGTIEADRTMVVPVESPEGKTVEVGGSFKGTLDAEGDEARLGLAYRISYLYGTPKNCIAKTEFKADVAIGNGQTLVMDDLVVEDGEQAEVLVFISALVVR